MHGPTCIVRANLTPFSLIGTATRSTRRLGWRGPGGASCDAGSGVNSTPHRTKFYSTAQFSTRWLVPDMAFVVKHSCSELAAHDPPMAHASSRQPHQRHSGFSESSSGSNPPAAGRSLRTTLAGPAVLIFVNFLSNERRNCVAKSCSCIIK